MYVWSGVWQGMGWSSIIYISALSGVDTQTHEAAIIDGATKIQRMIHVDLPAIKPYDSNVVHTVVGFAYERGV